MGSPSVWKETTGWTFPFLRQHRNLSKIPHGPQPSNPQKKKKPTEQTTLWDVRIQPVVSEATQLGLVCLAEHESCLAQLTAHQPCLDDRPTATFLP